MSEEIERLAKSLNLQSHPEGGRFIELYRSDRTVTVPGNEHLYPGPRNAGTSIHYMLEKDKFVAFHQHKSDIIFFWHRGSTVKVHELLPDGSHRMRLLGDHYADPECNYQICVPHDHWYAKELVDETKYALYSAVVIPGFDFEDWEEGTKEKLKELFPEHADIIHKLCRK